MMTAIGRLLLLLLLVPFLLATTPTIDGPKEVPAGFHNTPPRIGRWKYIPIVVVCQGAPIDPAAIEAAIRWWKDRGHPFFGTVLSDDPLNKCTAEIPEGFITIKVGHQRMFTEDDDLAETHFNVDDETKEISWAKVYLLGAPLERVLEHELGHALGFMHTKEIGHLMHRTWLRGGWNDRGLASTAPVVSRKQTQGIERRSQPTHRLTKEQ
jgi:hypothetical protein